MNQHAPLPPYSEITGQAPRKRSFPHFLLELIFVGATVYFLFGVVFGIAVVREASMSPSIPSGSIVFFFRLNKQPKAGNVVIFSVSSNKKYLIKRVAATSGETVSIDAKGDFRVDGSAQINALLSGKATDEKSTVSYPLKVPVESVFVLGDNRSNSLDSRQLGVINLRKLTGTVLFVLRLP